MILSYLKATYVHSDIYTLFSTVVILFRGHQHNLFKFRSKIKYKKLAGDLYKYVNRLTKNSMIVLHCSVVKE